MSVRCRWAPVWGVVLLALSVGDVCAQGNGSGGEPAQVLKRFEQRPAVKSLPPEERRLPAPTPVAPTWEREVSFILRGVEFTGMTVYKPDELRYLYAPLLGQQVGLQDLRDLALAVTARYRVDGYLLSFAAVPPQTIADGVVRVTVVEAGVDGLIVTGAAPSRRWRPVAMANKVAAERPLDIATLERYSLLIDDLPGVDARAVLSPSRTVPGMSNLAVQMRERRADAWFRIDNRGTRYNGPVQGQAAVGVNSLLRAYDRTQFHGVLAESPEELQVISLLHDTPLGLEGTRLRLSGTASWQEPGYLLGDLDTDSESTRLRCEIFHPFVRGRQSSLSGRVVFDAFNIETEQFNTVVSREELRSLRVGATFDWADEAAGINLVDIELSQGIDAFGALDNDAANLSRAKGRNDYTKAAVYASRLQHVTGPWTLDMRAAGQYAFDHLLASEEFAYGGIPFGRAHDPSEESGDHGAAGHLELQYTRGADLAFLSQWQLFVYSGAGRVWRKDDTNREANETLADAGAGVRLWADDKRSFRLEAAKPLAGSVAAEEDDGYDWRFFFAVTAAF